MSPAWQNGALAAFVAAAAWLLRAAARREDWRGAWRQLTRSRTATVSLGVLAAYLAVGLLDCVAWRDPARGPDGAIIRDAAGAIILEARPLTLLDRLCTPLRARREKTYSAPLAARLFSRETVAGPGGRTIRDFPALKHPGSHPLGTDRVGNDVLYFALKGVRTSLLIAGLATLISVLLAIPFGLAAGYFGGRTDDAIQYGYTTLASIPDVLLIAAFIFVFVGDRPEWRMAALCVILGVTSWTGLCRLLRGEALKLRELEYVQAARALGASHVRVLARHLLPNVMHVVLISFVLRFSDLVLAEAVLSYLGIGVDPATGSWGHMINAARQELTRDPPVWWNLTAAFSFMFGLVLPANLFGDKLRDALDPRLRS